MEKRGWRFKKKWNFKHGSNWNQDLKKKEVLCFEVSFKKSPQRWTPSDLQAHAAAESAKNTVVEVWLGIPFNQIQQAAMRQKKRIKKKR